MSKGKFPVKLLMPYLGFYAASAIFGTYLNLYLDQIGFTKTQMGTLTSISTLFALLIQPFWGVASDRAKVKNRIVTLMMAGCCVTVLGFYLKVNHLWIMLIDCAFCLFYTPASPLMNDLILENLESSHSPYNFGQVRVGGTLGYAIGVLAAGQLLQEDYQRMFLMIALLIAFALFCIQLVPPVRGHRTKEKRAPFRALVADRHILLYIFLHLIFTLGTANFYAYYPLYFTSIGGSNSMLGILMFVTSMSEIPFWMIAGRLTKKLGHRKVMILAAVVTGLRWLALFVTTDLALIVLINISHGFGFVMMDNGIVTYINENVPKDLRATGQSLSGMINTIFSRVIGGVVIGWLCDALGVRAMLLVSALTAFAGALLFAVLHRLIDRTRKTEGGPR